MIALVVSLQPVLTSTLANRWLGERVRALQWLGLALGIAGVYLIVRDKATTGGATPFAWASGVVALSGITVGTLYQKRFGGGIDWRPGLCIQYGTALVMFALGAFAFETRVIHWTPQFVFAVAWLVLVLSVGAVWLLFYLIRRSAATRVVSLFYLTPPVTALMAWLLFDERLAPLALVGMAVCVAGVFLVNFKPRGALALPPAAAAVHIDRVRGHERAGVRAHEQHQFADLLGLAEALHRHVFEETLHQFRRGLRGVLERRRDRARRDRQRANALGGEFARHAHGHGHHRALGRGIMDRGAGAAAPMRHARHIDDDAEAVFQHMRQHRLHRVERAAEIEIEGLLHQLIVDVEKFGAADRGPGGIEQELHAAEGIDRALHHVVDLRARGDVGLQRQRLAARGIDRGRGIAHRGSR